MMSVHKKLMEARIKLQSAKLEKTGNNKFAGYTYFELGDFIPTVNTIFNEVGLCGVVSYAIDIATLTITDVDDGSQILITSPMAEAMLKGCHPIQNLGATETYTRRYLWVAAMEIVEHDALDSSPPVDTSKPEPKPELKSVGLEDFSEEEQQFLKDNAMEMMAMVKDNNVAGAHALLIKLDGDETLVTRTLVDSTTRAKINDYAKLLKEVK
jgi:ERF superfamily